VLRNYGGLPEKPGRDVDILTNDFGKFKQIIETVSQKVGYSECIFRRYDCLIKFHLMLETAEGFEILEIDVGWDNRWKGIPLIPPDLLDHHRLWRKAIYTLQPELPCVPSLADHGGRSPIFMASVPFFVIQ
jgi:hypothetical protein